MDALIEKVEVLTLLSQSENNGIGEAKQFESDVGTDTEYSTDAIDAFLKAFPEVSHDYNKYK